jgi:1-deoxy-D-xylulose-5-phosphate synthase
MDLNKYKVLSKVNIPEDLKKLSIDELEILKDEIRDYIIEVVSKNAGHLGGNLGAVEITIALHYIFNAPYDKIIWDVGHQAYGHKILTGRKEVFPTIRQYGGISGFPSIFESEYDAFGTGHSSTSISAALGMAVAAKLKGEEDRHIIAVIGDGAMTGGMAFEALNNAGQLDTNMLIILNDNKMSIDVNVGGLKDYLTDISTSKTYNKVKDNVWRLLSKLGDAPAEVVAKIDNAIKSVVLNYSNFFEAFGFRYFGPVDGHDLPRLIKTLEKLKDIKGPKILHVRTIKGKGFKPAEENQTAFHAQGNFDKVTGKPLSKSDEPKPPKYQDVFGETIIELAEKNPKIVGITPAMPTGSSLVYMMKKMPDRAFDVGIAEQHAVTFSAGLASMGLKPYCTIYSTFLQRGYDQLIHDVALQKLNVVFCIDRAGIVGEDGATHQGVFDLAYLRPIPNMIISAPMNEKELRDLMYTAQTEDYGPFAIRYPRGRGVMIDWRTPFEKLEIGKAKLVSEGKDIAILSIGHPGNFVINAVKRLNNVGFFVQHYNMIFLKPIDEDVLHYVFRNYNTIITVEDGVLKGGLASEVVEFKNKNDYSSKVVSLGVPDRFIDHGKPEELYKICGFDENSIYEKALEILKKEFVKH